MFSVSRSTPSFPAEIAHVRRIVAQADWDARPTLCYRMRAALREAMANLPHDGELDQGLRAVMRAAEHFSSALRPSFTPATIELMARIDEFEMAANRALAAQDALRPKAA